MSGFRPIEPYIQSPHIAPALSYLTAALKRCCQVRDKAYALLIKCMRTHIILFFLVRFIANANLVSKQPRTWLLRLHVELALPSTGHLLQMLLKE